MQIPSWFHHRLLRWTAAIAWSIWISILLIQSEANPIISLGLPSGPQTFARELFFTCLHLLAFAITCTLWQWALSASLRDPRKPCRRVYHRDRPGRDDRVSANTIAGSLFFLDRPDR